MHYKLYYKLQHINRKTIIDYLYVYILETPILD